jgi:penicillin-binding protein 1B
MPRRKARAATLALFVTALIAALAIVFIAERKISTLVVGGLGESFSTRVYSAPFAIDAKTSTPPAILELRLKRLGYEKIFGPPNLGQYSTAGKTLLVGLRGFKTPLAAQDPGLFELSLGPETWSVKDSSGAPVSEILLEPELVGELSDEKRVRRDPATSEEIPVLLKKAAISAEDKRFYSHWGIDARAMARALWADLRGRPLQGASTITQQLAKTLFLSPRRTIQRKLTEAALSLYLELRFSKERILALYLNEIYLGQDGPVSIAGVKAAARHYFGKELSELSAGDCAMLAGMIRSPHRYNPFRDPQAARRRRDAVLARMLEDASLSPEEERQALAEPLRLRLHSQPKTPVRESDYYLAEVVRALTPSYGEEDIYRLGLRIDTAMDPLFQSAAQKAVKRARTQAALVAIDPQTGNVLALSGGKDFSQSQFNRATQAKRQPGSSFKPFVYAAALKSGLSPSTFLNDEPRQYDSRTGPWRPRNFDNVYFGTATMREALAHSLNSATLDLADRVGIAAILKTARDCGVQSELEPSLATALGASELSLLELVSAYAPFANGGFRVEPRLVLSISDAEGRVLEAAHPERAQALESAVSYLLTSMLESAVLQGTGKSLAALGFTRPAAGKTGTTNDGRDAWFIGYTPDLLAGVWSGDDAHRKIGATGARNSLPIWADFMKQAVLDHPAHDFERPPGIVSVVIDPNSGARARSGCPEKAEELFIAGAEPKEDCPLHAGGLRGWIQKHWRGRK